MFWILVSLVAAPLAFLMVALLHRKLHQLRRRAELRIRSTHGIVEERFVKIGGIEQWIGIRGENENNPVLLLIHGGPGSPCSMFTPAIRSWESHFTVVQWDQQGSGKTLGRTGQGGTGELTMDRLILDGIEVTEFVCTRLRKDKAILLACSLGSTFGSSMIRRRPDLFHAYVGTDQNVGMKRGREANHEALLRRLRSAGLNKGVAVVEKIGSDPSRWAVKDFVTTAKWTMRSDPRSYEKTMELLKNAIWLSPSHTLRDIKVFISGMNFSISRLFPEVQGYDAWQEGIHFDIPFFILQREDDVLTPPTLAKAYFDDVIAPVKSMTLIRNAGHFASFAQPDLFLRELLVKVRPHAN